MLSTCNSCKYGKAHRKPIKKGREAPRAGKIGDEVHSDVWGPSPVQTIGSREYYSTYTDDNSRYSTLYLQRLKSETFSAYKRYEAYLLRQKGVHIKKLHTDRGCYEFLGHGLHFRLSHGTFYLLLISIYLPRLLLIGLYDSCRMTHTISCTVYKPQLLICNSS